MLLALVKVKKYNHTKSCGEFKRRCRVTHHGHIVRFMVCAKKSLTSEFNATTLSYTTLPVGSYTSLNSIKMTVLVLLRFANLNNCTIVVMMVDRAIAKLVPKPNFVSSSIVHDGLHNSMT